MARPNKTMLRIGEWTVNPATSQISRADEIVRLEARTMRLLVCLAERAGEVVSIDDLLAQVWPDVTVTSDSVYQAVASLRRQLGDDPRQPTYIATEPRLGYRMIATVSPWTVAALDRSVESLPKSGPASVTPPQPRHRQRMAVGIAVGITAILVFALWGRAKLDNHASAALPEKSVAVLPFLDLTEGMKEEEFADGVTEEIIDKLSKVPGLRVPTRTASFYYKYKQIPIVDIAKSLGVVYVLDGSTRKSGTSVRVAVRLVRADSGYVLWSETYDRPFTDRIAVQDEIAREVTNAVHAAITTQLHATSAWPFRCRAV